MLNRRALVLSGLVAALPILSACDQEAPGSGALTSKAYVLVDLSATWHSAASAVRNRAVLTEIGQGLALYAQNTAPPIEFQYRAIGLEGFDRAPLKVMRYEPSLAGKKPTDPSYLVRSLKTLRNMLGYDCVDGLLALPAEPSTEIQPVLASIAKRPEAKKTKKFIIIASDLREEMLGEPANLPDLSGFRVLLVTRPVEDDLVHRRQIDARIKFWRRTLERKKASVEEMLDADIKRTDVLRFLSEKRDE